METELYLERIGNLFDEYLKAAQLLEDNRKPSELFGLKFGPSDDPLHEHFAEKLGSILRDAEAENPESAQIRPLLEKIYYAPKEYPKPKSAFWMLIAVQGLTQNLIQKLDSADAGELYELYEKNWPRRTRLPVQDAVAKALRNKSRKK